MNKNKIGKFLIYDFNISDFYCFIFLFIFKIEFLKSGFYSFQHVFIVGSFPEYPFTVRADGK
jgi:hypothetical protein